MMILTRTKFSAVPSMLIPLGHLKVKVTDFEFSFKFLDLNLQNPTCITEWVYVWYDDIHVKILCSTIGPHSISSSQGQAKDYDFHVQFLRSMVHVPHLFTNSTTYFVHAYRALVKSM